MFSNFRFQFNHLCEQSGYPSDISIGKMYSIAGQSANHTEKTVDAHESCNQFNVELMDVAIGWGFNFLYYFGIQYKKLNPQTSANHIKVHRYKSTIMDQFAQDVQQFLFDKFLKKSKQLNQTVTSIQNSFLVWFNEVRQIDPCKLKEDEIQPLIDKLLNSKEGQVNFGFIDEVGFYHCWPIVFQLPFLELTQNGYFGDVETSWRIIFSQDQNKYVFVNKIASYATKEEFQYLCRKIDYRSKQLGMPFEELLNGFTKWIFLIKKINVDKLKRDEIQPLIDKFFNSSEGRDNINLLGNDNFAFARDNHLKFFRLTTFQERQNAQPGWWIEFNFDTEQYVLAPNTV